jgi:hypothetical protein
MRRSQLLLTEVNSDALGLIREAHATIGGTVVKPVRLRPQLNGHGESPLNAQQGAGWWLMPEHRKRLFKKRFAYNVRHCAEDAPHSQNYGNP